MQYDEIRNIVRRLRRNQTGEEKILWEYLRKRRLNGYRFLRQYPLFYDRSLCDQRFFVVDFYCPKLKIAIELDGKIHDYQKDRDKWRDEIIQSHGIILMRIKNEELINIELITNKIKEHLPSFS